MSRRKLEELEEKFIVDELPSAGETLWGELKTCIGSVRIVDLKSLERAEDYIKFLKSEFEK